MDADGSYLIAFHDRERKGIFIHAALLRQSPFTPGDRFAVRTFKTRIFTVTLERDEEGEIVYDRHGIFLPRSRRVDMLMGGIFDKHVVTIEPGPPGAITLRPLEIVLDKNQKWF
ncbi:MAG: hypothetical protein EHM15_02405 [Desulfobacteraceae bacterium]|nr:MAG: hypothetical protein EHM15_02405 [Desulfobacteraceae bacterium]